MVERKLAMRIPSIKTVVTVLALLEVWLLLQVPSVGDLLFNFVVGGELPGTDKVLSPTQMMLFLMGLFVLAAGLIFKKEIVAAAQKVGQPAAVAAPKQKPVKPAPPKVRKVHMPRQWPVPLAIVVLYARKIRGIVYAYARRIYASMLQLWAVTQPVISTMRHQVRRAGGAMQKGIIWFCVTELYLIYRLWVAVRAYSVAFWRLARPRIERCDHWIERRLRRNDHTAALLEMGAEFTATIRGWILRIRSMLSE